VPAPCLRQVRGSTGLDAHLRSQGVRRQSETGKRRSPRGDQTMPSAQSPGGSEALDRSGNHWPRSAQGAWRRSKGELGEKAAPESPTVAARWRRKGVWNSLARSVGQIRHGRSERLLEASGAIRQFGHQSPPDPGPAGWAGERWGCSRRSIVAACGVHWLPRASGARIRAAEGTYCVKRHP
jgi:hypothetical protein